MSEWEWIPVEQGITGSVRKIGVLDMGGAHHVLTWWPEYEMPPTFTHWCELHFPPLPEPPKSDLQVVCEWLGIAVMGSNLWSPRGWKRTAERHPEHEWSHDALLCCVTRALADKGWRLSLLRHKGYEISVWNRGSGQYNVLRPSLSEALLKAALWVMEQEQT